MDYPWVDTREVKIEAISLAPQVLHGSALVLVHSSGRITEADKPAE